jgi:hypothetical protein
MQGNEVPGTTHNQNKIIDILSSWLLASGFWLSQFRKIFGNNYSLVLFFYRWFS